MLATEEALVDDVMRVSVHRKFSPSIYLAPHAITLSAGPIERKLSTYFGPRGFCYTLSSSEGSRKCWVAV